MSIFSPFPYSYLVWLFIFNVIPLAILCFFNFDYFKKKKRIFLIAVIGAVIFSFPWDFIAIYEKIWYFEKPFVLGVYIMGLPIEEWLFIILNTLLISSITLLL